MSSFARSLPGSHAPLHRRPPALHASDDQLCTALSRCRPDVLAAARSFRETGNPAYATTVIRGIVERYTDDDRRFQLLEPQPNLRLVEDLGLDSLTLMEIVLLTEDALGLAIESGNLRSMRTLGQVLAAISASLRTDGGDDGAHAAGGSA